MSYLEQHYNEIFKKYSDEELIKDIFSYVNGGGNLNKTLSHFFKECIYECCGKKSNISPMEFLQNEEMVNKAIEYIKSKPKFFTSTNEVSNIESYLRNSVSWVRKVANFPCKEARSIYFRYFENALTDKNNKLNCLDTSCGFGSRMSSVILSGHNYFGIDPNVKLQNKLFECAKFYYDNGFIDNNQICNLYTQGSEILIEELIGIIDVAFTSPPYFNLEKYSDDECASTINYNNYDLWVNNFVIPTVYNTYKYLKVGGYAMINIKNLNKKEPLYDSYFNAFSSIDGFEYVETFDLNITKKQYGLQFNNEKGEIKNQEPIMCFRKVK